MRITKRAVQTQIYKLKSTDITSAKPYKMKA